MASIQKSMHGMWTSRWSFILAATGSAVGLGNIWKFPYIAGENGGAAFVLVYLVCIACIGIPIMIGEVMLGRRGRQSPIHSMLDLSKEAKATPAWSGIGWIGALAGFLILSFYSVIAGWAIAYFFKMAGGVFVGADADFVGKEFDTLLASPGALTFWHTIFMALTVFVVARGVNKGLETAVRILMPALFVMLIVLLGYSLASGNFEQATKFLFSFDASKLTAEAVLVALGHAFFTLSLGMGAIMVYGAYMPKDVSIGKTVAMIAILDTIVALAAGLVIFSVVFANGLDAGKGPGLMFVTLPIAFGHMPGGVLFGSVFFILVIFAAWSSAISLVEPTVAWAVERLKLSRVISTVMIGVFCWLLGIACLLSLNLWSEYKVFDKTILDLLDFITTNIMLPLGGLLIALFVGWVMPKTAVSEELNFDSEGVLNIVLLSLKFVAPFLVVLVFAHSLGWIG